MKKTELADAVILADTHLRDDQSACRTDDYFTTQLKKLSWAVNLLRCGNLVRAGAPLIIAGDVFDHWKPSPLLLKEVIIIINSLKQEYPVVVVAGQHDLPQHNLDLLSKTGLAVLEKACEIHVLTGGARFQTDRLAIYGWSWGDELPTANVVVSKPSQATIGVYHFPTWYKDCPYGPVKIPDAVQRLRQLPPFDLTVVGDNHIPFTVYSKDDRVLLSPGSMCRMSADQQKYIPKAWLYFRYSGLKSIPIPIVADVVSRKHIEAKAERNKTLNAFIEGVADQKHGKMSFVKRLEMEMEKKEHDQELKQVMWEAIHEETM